MADLCWLGPCLSVSCSFPGLWQSALPILLLQLPCCILAPEGAGAVLLCPKSNGGFLLGKRGRIMTPRLPQFFGHLLLRFNKHLLKNYSALHTMLSPLASKTSNGNTYQLKWASVAVGRDRLKVRKSLQSVTKVAF